MQGLQDKITNVESNVTLLIRKLNETEHSNQQLILEINKLKQEIKRFEEVSSTAQVEQSNSKSTSDSSEEKYMKIKEEITHCIQEIDACISSISK